jgi:hypothetical protein
MDVGNQASISIHAEERYRRGSDIKTLESELDPVVKYQAIWRGGQDFFVALYQPRLIYTRSADRRLPDPNLVNPGTLNLADPNDTPFGLLHNGGVGYETTHPRWRLTLYQFAAYGQISTTALLIQAPWAGDGPPPDPQPIIPATIGARFTLLFAQTQLTVPIRLSPRTALIPSVVYNAFGGADQASRGVLALTYGPGASLTLDHMASKNDRLISLVGAGLVDTRFQDDRNNVSIYRAEVVQTWRHFYNANLSTDVFAGGTTGGDSINGFTIFSETGVSMLYDTWPIVRILPGAPPGGGPEGRGHHVQLGLGAKVTPWIDLFSGDLEQRLVLSAAANYFIGPATLHGGVSHARDFNNPRTVATYEMSFAEGGLRYNFSPTFFGDVGTRYGAQSFNNAVRFSDITAITFYGGLTYAPLATRF